MDDKNNQSCDNQTQVRNSKNKLGSAPRKQAQDQLKDFNKKPQH